jgi:hypothetical protein
MSRAALRLAEATTHPSPSNHGRDVRGSGQKTTLAGLLDSLTLG